MSKMIIGERIGITKGEYKRMVCSRLKEGGHTRQYMGGKTMIKKWIIRMFQKWVENESIEYCTELDICENCPWYKEGSRICNAVFIHKRLSEVEKKYE